MTTSTDKLKLFYQLLNVSSLTNLLSGGIYRNQRLEDSILNDVVIVPRFMKSDYNTGVNNGQIDVVIIIKKIGGLPDLATQLLIEREVIRLLQNSEKQQNTNSFYFELEETTEYDNYDGQILFSSLYLTFNIHKP